MRQLSFNPTVRELREYVRNYGVSLPSRIKKDDLHALANMLRYGSRADAIAAVGSVGAHIADVSTFDAMHTPSRS